MTEPIRTHRGKQLHQLAHETQTIYIEMCVFVTLVCNFFILWGNPIYNNTIISLGTRVMILFLLGLAIVAFLNSLRRMRLSTMNAWFTLIVVLTAFCGVASSGTGFAGLLVNYLCFLMLPSFMMLYYDVQHTRTIKKAVYVAALAYTGLFLWLNRQNFAYRIVGEYGLELGDNLTLGYTNPNETGMYLLITFFILLVAFFDHKKWWQKGLYAAATAANMYFIMLTDSRACIILAWIALVVTVFNLDTYCGRIIQRIVLAVPAFFLVLSLIFPNFLARLTVMGEIADTGRSAMFSAVIGAMKPIHYLIGNFFHYPGSNLHNSYISLLAMFGLPVTVLYLRFMGLALSHYHTRITTKSTRIAFMCFLCVILHGVAEAAFLVSGVVYAGMSSLLFLLMLPDESAVTEPTSIETEEATDV